MLIIIKKKTFHRFWLGINKTIDDDWTYQSSGSPIDWNNWATGQPDNSNGNQGCVIIWFLATNGFKWHDHKCFQTFPSICEMRPL